MGEKLTNGLKSLVDEREEVYFAILTALAYIAMGIGFATFSEVAASTVALYGLLLLKKHKGASGE